MVQNGNLKIYVYGYRKILVDAWMVGVVFQIPDVYGVYQFKVNYHRLGLTRISTANQVRYATSTGTVRYATGTVPITVHR